MTARADEVWALHHDLIKAQQENAWQLEETDRQFKETALSFRETDRRIQETDRLLQETTRASRETDRRIHELGKQIGGLGEKFGSFTEGLALPSMETILRARFGMEVVSPSVRVAKDGQHLEIDVLAYANGPINATYLVEVKSHPREEAVVQMKQLLARFRAFFPEHRDKRLYGILAAVDLPPAVRERAPREGF